MSFVNPNVVINGTKAELRDFGNNFASIRLADHQYRLGEVLNFTIFVQLMGRHVGVNLRGEVVKPHNDTIDVTYSAPTLNWDRMLRVMNRRSQLN